MAAVLDRLQPIRVRRTVAPDDRGWVEASFRIWSVAGAGSDLLALGAEVEVLEPPRLRDLVATTAQAIATLYERRDDLAATSPEPP